MTKAEEIFHNKMVHYNSRQFPKGMQKMFIKAMEEYCQRELDELKAEIEELKKTIDFKDRLYKGLNGMFQEKESEVEMLKVEAISELTTIRNDILNNASDELLVKFGVNKIDTLIYKINQQSK